MIPSKMLLTVVLLVLLSTPSQSEVPDHFKIDFDNGIENGTLITVFFAEDDSETHFVTFNFKSKCAQPTESTDILSHIKINGNSLVTNHKTKGEKWEDGDEETTAINWQMSSNKMRNRKDKKTIRMDFYLWDNKTIEVFMQGFSAKKFKNKHGYGGAKCLVIPSGAYEKTGTRNPIGYVSKPYSYLKYVKDTGVKNDTTVVSRIVNWPFFGIIQVALLMNVSSNEDYEPILGVRTEGEGNTTVFELRMNYNTTLDLPRRHMRLSAGENNSEICNGIDGNDIADLEHISIERTDLDEITVELYHISDTVKSCTVQLENSTLLHIPLELFIANGAAIYGFKHNFPTGLIKKAK